MDKSDLLLLLYLLPQVRASTEETGMGVGQHQVTSDPVGFHRYKIKMYRKSLSYLLSYLIFFSEED